MEKISKKKSFDDREVSETSVKYVVIASGDEDAEDAFKLPGEPITRRPLCVPGIAPQFSTRNRPFHETKVYSLVFFFS